MSGTTPPERPPQTRLLWIMGAAFVVVMGVLYSSLVAESEAPTPAAQAVRIAPTPAPVEADPTPTPRPPPRAAAKAPAPAAPTPAPPVDEGETAVVRGHVRDDSGNPRRRGVVFLIANGRRTKLQADEDGYFEREVAAGTLHAYALRRDGALSRRSNEVALQTVDGGEYDVEFVLPTEITGGLGMAVATGPNGARILSMVPGGQAEYIGLRKGDFLVEVDGTDLPGLSRIEITSLLRGPEGSTGTLVVKRAGTGTEEELTFEREFVDKE